MSGKKLSRNKSVMSIQANPLESGRVTGTNLNVESIVDAKPISENQLEEDIMDELRTTEDNEERLDILDEAKIPYLFTSAQLLQILEITTSVKTRISMITMIGPRLIDPAAKTAEFTGLFRYSGDKSAVEEVLKARTNTLGASRFRNKPQVGNMLFRGGPGGRGAQRRGSAPDAAPGPGRGAMAVRSAHNLKNPALQESASGKLNKSASHVTESTSGKVGVFSALPNKNSLNNTSDNSLAELDGEEAELVDDSQLGLMHQPNAVTGSSGLPPTKRGNATGADTPTNRDTPVSIGGSSVNSDATPQNNTPFEAAIPAPRSIQSSTPRVGGQKTPVRGRSPMPGEQMEIAPGFVLTTRAPQKGPTPPLSRSGSRSDLAKEAEIAQRAAETLQKEIREKERAERGGGSMVKLLSSKFSGNNSSSTSSTDRSIKKSLSKTQSSEDIDALALGGSGRVASMKAGIAARKNCVDTPEKTPEGTKPTRTVGRLTIAQMSPKKASLSESNIKDRCAGPEENASPVRPPTSPVRAINRTMSGHIDASEAAPVGTVAAKMKALTRRHSEMSMSFSGPVPNTSAASTATTTGSKSATTSPAAITRRPPSATFVKLVHTSSKSVGSIVSPPNSVKGSDMASRCGDVLGMTRVEFLALELEGPIGKDTDSSLDRDAEHYNYRELVRRNYTKEYQGLLQSELEKYLSDEGFVDVFQKSREEFYKLPRWRQMENKKKALLF